MLELQKGIWVNIGDVDKTVRQELLGKIAVVFSTTTPTENTSVYDYITGDKPHALNIPSVGQFIWLRADTSDTVVYVNNLMHTVTKTTRLKNVGEASAFTAGQEQELLKSYKYKDDYILAIGQSNAVYGKTNGGIYNVDTLAKLFTIQSPTVPIEIKQMSANNCFIAGEGVKQIGYLPKLAELSGNNIALCAKGSTGFSTRDWIGGGEMLLRSFSLMRQLNGTCVGIIFSGGEADASMHVHFAGYLKGLAYSLRQELSKYQNDAQSVPFVTGRLLPTSAAAGGAVDNALASVASYIPFSASVDVSNLPADPLSDNVHYSTEQQFFLAPRYLQALDVAKLNSLNDQLPSGSHLVHSSIVTDRVPSLFNLMSGGQIRPELYFGFDKLTQCINDKGFRLRVEITYDDDTTAFIEFYQLQHPFFSKQETAKVEVIDKSANFVYSIAIDEAFSGMNTASSSATVLHLHRVRTEYFSAIGAVSTHAATGMWIWATSGELVKKVVVYAIKE